MVKGVPELNPWFSVFGLGGLRAPWWLGFAVSAVNVSGL